MAFKIKSFPSPVVGNRGDSDTKGANESRDVERINFQMDESPGSARGGLWRLTLTGALK